MILVTGMLLLPSFFDRIDRNVSFGPFRRGETGEESHRQRQLPFYEASFFIFSIVVAVVAPFPLSHFDTIRFFSPETVSS